VRFPSAAKVADEAVGETSVGDFVVAGVAAGLAVVETVVAKTRIDLALAEAAVFFTLAALLALVALGAEVLGFRRHK